MREHGTWGMREGTGSTGGAPLAFPEGARLTHLRAQPVGGGGSFTITHPTGQTYLVTLPAGTGAVDLYPNGDLPVSEIAFVTMVHFVAEFVR